MENKKYQTVDTIPKSKIKILKRNNRYLTHKYMTVHFSGLVQALQWKVAGINYFYFNMANSFIAE